MHKFIAVVEKINYLSSPALPSHVYCPNETSPSTVFPAAVLLARGIGDKSEKNVGPVLIQHASLRMQGNFVFMIFRNQLQGEITAKNEENVFIV
jgi:hypothetical protein